VKPIGPHEDPWPKRADRGHRRDRTKRSVHHVLLHDPDRDVNGRRDDPDEFLLDLVAGRLLASGEVRGRHVSLMVQNGAVILEGSVNSVASKDAADRLAWSTPGVADVLNSLIVEFSSD
jgi:osmotically-inducible protein OsmY